MELDIFDETKKITKDQEQLVYSLLTFAAEQLGLPSTAEMSVTFVTNDRIQEINRDYRHKDQPTDVISFALEDETEDEIEVHLEEFADALPLNIGDILISVDRTEEQAKEYGHSFERELGFLALHGFLHLNGYDHMEPEDEKEMFDLQKRLLKEYGLGRE
ncbi:rRNA maturation RNase YbeY [Pisciglobus halotolerans]|uniref:Endoribonuclease YbeY n=1 Tax=Pisciglobus halotolerans TaxID=745365 RepID=A0A1I3B9T1_9LACT|nr:rRNA maturation RNase YbeY [Pisciglobus halotolerans]SFH59055.1 probable rRNA maturation factor [Pisciglobus halotolerans]